MWGSTHEECTEILKQFGMLETSVKRILVTPYMLNYAEMTIDKESKELYNLKIAEFYEEMLRQCYNSDIKERSKYSYV
jgi:hypothetical protein